MDRTNRCWIQDANGDVSMDNVNAKPETSEASGRIGKRPDLATSDPIAPFESSRPRTHVGNRSPRNARLATRAACLFHAADGLA